MSAITTDSPIHDIAFLSRADHRIPALIALAERPRSRAELCELTGVSASTIRRTVGEFETRNWVRKERYQYVATRLGEFVAAGIGELIDRFEVEGQLREVWEWLPAAVSEFTIEAESDVTVTVAKPDSPYRPVNRFRSLLEATDGISFLRPEVALMEPCFDVLVRLMEDGADITLVDRPSCHTYFLSTYPEQSAAMLERENFTVLAHEDLPPYGVGILDEVVVISCYESDSGTVQAVVDTTGTAVREWAESTYREFETEARPVTAAHPAGEPSP